jgi:hypothetical protein
MAFNRRTDLDEDGLFWPEGIAESTCEVDGDGLEHDFEPVADPVCSGLSAMLSTCITVGEVSDAFRAHRACCEICESRLELRRAA